MRMLIATRQKRIPVPVSRFFKMFGETFAIHRNIDATSCRIMPDTWTVSHYKTGLSVPGSNTIHATREVTEALARKILKAVGKARVLQAIKRSEKINP